MTPPAEAATYAFWHSKSEEVYAYLISRGFTSKAASKAFDTFVETMCYLARETGQIGFRQIKTEATTLDMIDSILSRPGIPPQKIEEVSNG